MPPRRRSPFCHPALAPHRRPDADRQGHCLRPHRLGRHPLRCRRKHRSCAGCRLCRLLGLPLPNAPPPVNPPTATNASLFSPPASKAGMIIIAALSPSFWSPPTNWRRGLEIDQLGPRHGHHPRRLARQSRTSASTSFASGRRRNSLNPRGQWPACPHRQLDQLRRCRRAQPRSRHRLETLRSPLRHRRRRQYPLVRSATRPPLRARPSSTCPTPNNPAASKPSSPAKPPPSASNPTACATATPANASS